MTCTAPHAVHSAAYAHLLRVDTLASYAKGTECCNNRKRCQAALQSVPALLHVVEAGNTHAQHFALRSLFLLSGVSSAVHEQLANAEGIAILAHRAWHGKPDVQAVALLLLREVSRTHTRAFIDAHTDALPLMIALEGSPVADVASIAKDAVKQLEELPIVKLERAVQVRTLLHARAAACALVPF